MPLIVEDGSIVAGADSFISLSDARTMAASLGLTLPVDDVEAEINLRNAGLWVNSQEPSLQGVRVSIDQTMCEPRSGATKHGFEIPEDSVPSDAICSQVQCAALITGGVDPFPTDNGKEIQSQEVSGAVKRSFFESGSTASSIKLTAAINCLYPISKAALGCGLGSNFCVTRG